MAANAIDLALANVRQLSEGDCYERGVTEGQRVVRPNIPDLVRYRLDGVGPLGPTTLAQPSCGVDSGCVRVSSHADPSRCRAWRSGRCLVGALGRGGGRSNEAHRGRTLRDGLY